MSFDRDAYKTVLLYAADDHELSALFFLRKIYV